VRGLRTRAVRAKSAAMLRKVLTAIVVIPLAILIVAFAVANRQVVTVSFDPFSSTDPAYAAKLPLFVLIFALVILGIIVGGVATWLRQASWRRTARALDADVRTLHQELEAMRRRMAEEEARRDEVRGEDARSLSLPSPRA
jgi:uncharacterized integral membrane protein